MPEIELEERSEIKKQIDKFVRQKPDAVRSCLETGFPMSGICDESQMTSLHKWDAGSIITGNE